MQTHIVHVNTALSVLKIVSYSKIRCSADYKGGYRGGARGQPPPPDGLRGGQRPPLTF